MVEYIAESLKEFAIRNFGTNDKFVLLTGIYVAIGLFAVVLGVVALRWLWVGVLGLVGFAAVGVWAATTVNASEARDVLPTVVGAVAAIAVMVVLGVVLGAVDQRPVPSRFRSLARTEPGSGAGDGRPAGEALKPAVRPDEFRGVSRRGVLAGGVAGGVVVVAAAAGVGGRALQHARFDAAKSRQAVRLPKPASPAPALPSGVALPRLKTPFVTANKDFYRIDTALTVPQIVTDDWSLRIHGRVDQEMTLTYDDLLSRPLMERWITMTCVSNPVGGPYVSTAKFLGVPLAPLLKEVGVHADADQLVGRSIDGMTIGTPTAVLMDGRDAMIAVGMNDEPLPLEHGFPARTVVPGLFGYVSATKWLIELEATTFADYDTYWVQREWVPKAPIRLEARIDTPRGFQSVQVGERLTVGGVAWHQHVGIESVQVRFDGGDWQDARLGRVPTVDTWVQWSYVWKAAGNGPVTIEVRAIDRNGEVQEQKRRNPFPSGASGWHSVVVSVT